MKINNTCFALGLFSIVLLVIVMRPGAVVEGLSHKTTSIQRPGIKLTREALLQFEAGKLIKSIPIQLYEKGICKPKIAQRGKRSVKICNCGIYGFKNSNAFPLRKCSATDHIF